MRIDSIRLENYRCHADLTVEFGPGFNVIVGVNGSGKTSLLSAICEALNGVLGHLQVPGFSRLQDADAVRLLVTHVAGRYRFEPQYPVMIKATGYAIDPNELQYSTPEQHFDLSLGKASPVHAAEVVSAPFRQARYVLRDAQSFARPTQSPPMPLAAFYRANRHWNPGQTEPMQAATQRHARADGYSNWWDASLDGAALLTWVISKHLERFEAASETGKPLQSLDDDELVLVNAALAEAVEGIKGLRYDFSRKSLLVEWQSGAPTAATPFENLSDGQKAVIGLVADIARRMCLLNPQLGQEVTLKTDGVVLIDELDVHLHPHWQRILTNGLKKAFPAVQFIVASHSPQVLGELSPDEIILLRPEGTAHPQVSYGLTSSQVLEEIMGTTARTADVESSLSVLFGALERNELDQARKTLKQLKDAAPGIAELAGAEALLKRKELLGR